MNEIRLIIAGSRCATLPDVYRAIDLWLKATGAKPSVVLSGTARGADRHGEAWARHVGIPIERYPAAWAKHGRSAGHRRNARMAEHATHALIVWDGRSKGSESMIRLSERLSLLVYVYPCREMFAPGMVGGPVKWLEVWRGGKLLAEWEARRA